MALIEPAVNPYDVKLGRLKDRREGFEGKDKKLARNKQRIQNTKAKSYLWNQANPPDVGLPSDAASISQKAGATQTYSNAVSSNAAQVAAKKNNYGFGGDTSNPYSQAAMLQKSYDQNRAGTLNSSAAAGQLYAGSMQNAQDANLSNLEAANSSLYGKYQDDITLLADKLLLAEGNKNEAILGADEGAITRASAVDAPDEGPEPSEVGDFTRSKMKKYLELRKAGKDKKADAIRTQLKELDAWSQADVKKLRENLRDKGKL